MQVLVGNPFYLVSAAMMLYGLYLVSIKPQLAGQEESQLAFNFSSLQLYEVLLVVTAAVLARRAIWYDSTLLVGLENMFLFVPFILISQATLLADRGQWTFALAGASVAFALGRLWAQRHYLPELNFPKRLLVLGGVLLAINVAFPVTFRSLVESDSEAWTKLSFYGWLLLLPALMAMANLLPRATHWGGLAPQRSWLPISIFLIWIVATAVHFHSVNYVDNQKFQLHLVAPLLWALVWTLRNRATDFTREPPQAWMTILLVAPAMAALAGIAPKSSTVFVTLSALNALFYGLHYALTERRLSYHLLLFSLLGLLAGMPEGWGQEFIPDFTRAKCAALSLAAYVLLWNSLSKDPRHALLGALVAGLATQYEFARLDYVEQFALQNAVLYLLLHSLRWNDGHQAGSKALRFALALGWLAHSIAWLRIAAADVAWTIALAGALVVVVGFLARLARGSWVPIIIPLSGALVFLSVPTNLLVELLRITPTGHLTVLGSFIVFAAGTALALTKPRWSRWTEPPKALSSVGPISSAAGQS